MALNLVGFPERPRAILASPEGTVRIEPASAQGLLRVSLHPNDPNLFVPLRECETSLPIDVVAEFLKISFPWLCESLARHDDPTYVAQTIERQILAYFDRDAFRGKRMLDFGCGSGASTFHMAALLPETEVVGVELTRSNVDMARKILAARRFNNAQFHLSPDPESLPRAIGTFDFVMLSAVYEHLLPRERERLMPLIWSHLKPGGVLFINQTPYRYFPFEHHTTGLWFVNYLPDKLTCWLARRYSRENVELNRARDWEGLLRGGIRGGTEPGILRNVRRANLGEPVILQPKNQDRAAYWLSRTKPQSHRAIKRTAAALFRATDWLFGTVPSMNLDVVIRKLPLPESK